MKIKKLVMAVLLVITMLFVPNVFAAEEIELKNITEAGKGGNAEYCPNPTVNGLTLSFDGVVFKDKGDYVSYDVDVVNNSDEDLEISNVKSSDEKNYFNYEFSFEDNNNIVPKKSTKKMNIKISFENDITDPSAFVDGVYTQQDELSVELAVQQPANNPSNNPKTGSGLVVALILVFLAVIAAISMILTNKTKLNKHLIMIIALTLAIIPVTIYAAKMVTIKLNAGIIVDKNYTFYFIDELTTCSESSSFDIKDARIFSNDVVLDNESAHKCVDGYYKLKYNYTNPDITWADVLSTVDIYEEDLADIHPEGSDTPVNLTDKIIHGTTYIWGN